MWTTYTRSSLFLALGLGTGGGGGPRSSLGIATLAPRPKPPLSCALPYIARFRTRHAPSSNRWGPLFRSLLACRTEVWKRPLSRFPTSARLARIHYRTRRACRYGLLECSVLQSVYVWRKRLCDRSRLFAEVQRHLWPSSLQIADLRHSRRHHRG